MDKILYFNSSITSKSKGASYVYATATVCVKYVGSTSAMSLLNAHTGDISHFVEPTDCQTQKRARCHRKCPLRRR